MSDPTTQNQVASTVNSVLKTIIEGAGTTALENALIVEFPWLGLPVIKQIFEFILNKVSAIIYQDAAEAATKLIIDLQVNGEESSVGNAFKNLQMALASGDQNAINQTSKELDQAYASLIHSDGSSSP